jgi:anti-sigma factor RsiW
MKECLAEEILQQYFDGELERVRLESTALHLAGCKSCAARLRELESEIDLVTTALAPEFEVVVPTEHLRRRIDAAVSGLHLVRPQHSSAQTPAGRNWLATLSAVFTLSPQRAFAYGGLAAAVLFAAILGITQWQSEPSSMEPERKTAAVIKEDIRAPEPQDKKEPVLVVAKNTHDSKPVASAKPSRKFRPATPHSGSSSQTVAEVKLLPGERSYLKTIAALDSTIHSGKTTMRPALQAEYERNLALVDRAIAATRSAAKLNPNDPDAADFMFAAYQSKVDLLNTIADARVYNRPR